MSSRTLVVTLRALLVGCTGPAPEGEGASPRRPLGIRDVILQEYVPR